MAAAAALPLLAWPGGPLPAQVAGEIQGRVVNAGTGSPISDAQVEVLGLGLAVRSDADGRYRIRGLEPRTFQVQARALGFVHRTVEVTASNTRISELDIALQPATPVLAPLVVRAARDTAAPNAMMFTRSVIEAAGARDLGDLLQQAPGVVVTRSGGPGQPAQISIRGSASNQVLVLLDGVPLNSDVSGTADLSTISLEHIERLTVLTGAQSARYGPRAMAGVIDIVTRRARQEQNLQLRGGALGERGVAASVATTANRAGSTYGGTLAIDHRALDGDFTYQVPALRGGGEARRLNADAATTQLNANGSLDRGAAQLTVRAAYGTVARGMAGTIVQPSLSGRQVFSRVSSGATAQWTPQHWALNASTDLTQERAAYTDPTPPFGTAFADSVTATSINAMASITGTWGGFTAATGVDMRRLAVASNALSADAPASQVLAGVWITAHRELVPGGGAGPWRMIGEVATRVDHSSLLPDVATSPRVAFRVEHQRLSLSTSYGSGFSPPTLSDQFFHEGVQVRANPSLRPERVRHDLEVRATLRDMTLGPIALQTEAAAFRSDVDGMILWFPNFQFIWSPSNYDVHRRGWETRVRLRVPTLHVEFSGSVDHTDVTYAGGVLTGQVVYRPRLTASLQSALSIAGVQLDVVTRHVGSRRSTPGSSLNRLDPYDMTDLRVSRTLTRGRLRVTPQVAVENLFNRNAAMLVDYPFPTRLWSLSVRLRHATSLN